MTTDSIISKVWSFCHTLRDDGVGYGDYLEQLTYLIFLKMADEYSRPPHSRKVGVPARFAWPVMRPLKGAELEVHYVEALRELGLDHVRMDARQALNHQCSGHRPEAVGRHFLRAVVKAA